MYKWIKKIVLCLCCTILLSSGFQTFAAEEMQTFYQIMVNRAANCVTVYELKPSGEYVPLRSFACSTGKEFGSTPLGTTFKTSDYYDWRLMVDGTYGQYAVRFYRSILFHSVPYFTQSPDSLEADQYNLLGSPASLGCVRMAVADVKWIYDNCPKGTSVIVYDDELNPGPLGKPETFYIAEDHPFSGWDMTDPNPLNPWRVFASGIYLTRDMGDGVIYLPVGADMTDLKNAIGAVGYDGVVLTPDQYEVYINGNFDFNTFGAYRVWIKVKNQYGITTEKEMMLAMVNM